MCVDFNDNRMYAAFDADTGNILVGGGNDKMLPFVRLDPKGGPSKLMVDGVMHNVKYMRISIVVDRISQQEEDSYTHEIRHPKPNIEKAVDEAAKISNERYEEILHDAVVNAAKEEIPIAGLSFAKVK